MLSSQAVGPKLEWVRRHEPEVFEGATGWFGSNSYVAAKLTGEYVMDHHTASQCDPLYATRHSTGTRVGDASAPSSAAPAGLAERGRRHGAGRSRGGDRYPRGTPVVAGTVDAYSEAFSVGVRDPVIRC